MQIKSLNTLRSLAAFIVLITHFSDATNWLDTVLGGRAGQYGVMLFFMISGFLMSYLYIDKEANKSNIKQYALARAGRVIPLFFLVVVLSFVFKLNDIDGLYNISTFEYLISHLIFLDGEFVLWSIAPEIQFYILFIVLWALTAWRPGYLYLAIVITFIMLFFTNFPRPHGEISGIQYDFHLFRSLPYFLMGVLMGKHYKTLQIPNYLKSNWFIFSLLLIPLMYPEFTLVNSAAKERMWLSFGPLLVMSMVFFSIVFLVPKNNILIANKISDFIGKISYSLYLLHMPILWQANKMNFSVEVKLLIFISLSILTAYLSYVLIESPSSKFIRSLLSNDNNYEKIKKQPAPSEAR